MIAIIDYGMGNIHSVQKALESFGAKTLVTNQPQEVKICDKIVLPGVGAFDDAMRQLETQGLVSALLDHIKKKRIFLGICLGLQLLFEESDEARGTKGLGVLKGKVAKFSDKMRLKVPHMGWNQLKKLKTQNSKFKNGCPLLKDIPDNSFVYYCHSYYPSPKDKAAVAATTDYGIDFACVIYKDNIFGTQFHPEKSQETGLKIIKNFVAL